MRPLSREQELQVRSIAQALEQSAPAVQEDLLGGSVQLLPTPSAEYYAELARGICALAFRRIRGWK